MSNYSFFIGIDVSKAIIDVSYHLSGQATYLGEYLNSEEGFISLIKDLSTKTDKSTDKWFVCFENTGSYSKALFKWFFSQGIPCLEENPLKISKSLGLRRGKSDKVDSIDICQYAFEKRDSLRSGKPLNPLIIKLKTVLSRRELLVKQRAALQVSLKEQKTSMDHDLYEELERANKEMLDYYGKQVKELEDKMEEIIGEDPVMAKNHKLLQSIIGIARIISAYLIATTHNFILFNCAKKYSCYCGIAPFPNSSGIKKGRTRVSHMANKRMKSLLSNSIPSVIAHDPEISHYYKRKIEQGKKPGVVSNAIKNKLIHRAFAVIRRQTPFVKMMNYT